MAIDRRILSILYYNGITDVNMINSFIGESHGYYQIEINGIIKNLKIPNFIYNDEELDENIDEELDETIDEELDENIGETGEEELDETVVWSSPYIDDEKIIIDYYSSDFDLELFECTQFRIENKNLRVLNINLPTIKVNKDDFNDIFPDKKPKPTDLIFFNEFYKVVDMVEFETSYELSVEKYEPILMETSIENINSNIGTIFINENLVDNIKNNNLINVNIVDIVTSLNEKTKTTTKATTKATTTTTKAKTKAKTKQKPKPKSTKTTTKKQ